MGPVAQRVIHELRNARRNQVVDLQALREARELYQELDVEDDDLSRLPPDQGTWMKAFQTLAALSNFLLGADALRPLAKRVNEAEDHYMPGGPPMSPVLDSFFMSWWLLDLGTGPQRETLCSIIASAGSVLGMPPGLTEMMRVLGNSRLGVYRVTETGPNRVSLQDLSNEHTIEALLPVDLKSRGSLWLTRLLPPLTEASKDWVVWTTPYLLRDPNADRDWLDYFERIASGGANREERIASHFKTPPTATHWLDYVFDAYAGVSSEGAVILSGIPDRPHTLPHSAENEEAALLADTPLNRVRKRLWVLCDDHGFEEEEEGQRALRAAIGAPEEPLNDEVSRIMQTAYRMYGQLDDDGMSAIDLLRRNEAELSAEERNALGLLEAGWFSLFEVLRIRTDEGMELRDQLRRRRLWISERMATRQAELGDVLCGWVLVDEGEYTLEGSLLRVPSRLAPLFTEQMRRIRDDLARRYPKLGWKKRAGLLARVAAPVCDTVFAHAPAPTVVNMDQHELVFSEARYEIIDRARLKSILSEHFEEARPDSFSFVEEDRLIADLELTPKHLVVRCNSRERLRRMKEHLDELLAGVAKHKLDSHEDLQRALEESLRRPRRTRPLEQDPADVPPEVKQAVHQIMRQQMVAWLDTPIPLLDGKTPRQAVRSGKGRDDVTHLLVRQQQGFNANPETAGIDLSEIWEALGLSPPPDLATPLDADERTSIQEHERAGTSPQTRRDSPKVGRNDPCPCGSGKKFKRCCLHQTRTPFP